MSDRSRTSSQLLSLQQLLPHAVFTTDKPIRFSGFARSPRSLRGSHAARNLLIASGDSDVMLSGQADDCRPAAILTDELQDTTVAQCIVPDVPSATAIISHALAGNPSQRLITIGILGTHGKTSVALHTAAMFKKVSGIGAYWTTLGASNHGDSPTNKTEDRPTELHRWLARAADDGCVAAVIEISDQMISQRSCAGLQFDLLVIPSLREDQRYDKATAAALTAGYAAVATQLKSHGLVVANADDARLQRWIERHELPAIRYGLHADAEVKGQIRVAADGSRQMLVTAGRAVMPVEAEDGEYLLRHRLAATAVGYACGLELQEIATGIQSLRQIPGRLQPVANAAGRSIFVDRADTADRLAVAMHSLPTRSRRIVVAEIPTSATAEQRAAFGRVLEKTASVVYLTQSRRALLAGQPLAWEVIDGCDRPGAVQYIPNRREAIATAVSQMSSDDCLVLCGMGTEAWTTPSDKCVYRDELLVKQLLSTDDNLASPVILQVNQRQPVGGA